jgi:hypothetical protein
MAIYNINVKESKLNFGKDGIITQNYIAGLPGGRALDVTGYALDVIYAGTPVIVKDGNYKPFPVVIATEALPTAAVSAQTAGSPIVGTVYEGVTATTANAVKCAKSDKTIVYLAASAATGNASADKTYYTKDTSNTTTVEKLDENGNTYYVLGSLPANHDYAGILYKSILKTKPAAAVMTRGQVNVAALYFPMDDILSAVKSALPLIEFIKDEAAAAE